MHAADNFFPQKTPDYLSKLRAQIYADRAEAQRRDYRYFSARVFAALTATGNLTAISKLEKCTERRRCDCLPCKSCNDRWVRRLQGGFKAKIIRDHGSINAAAPSLRYVTQLYHFVSLGRRTPLKNAKGVDLTWEQEIAQVLKQRKNRLGAQFREEFPTAAITGAFEIEPVSLNLLSECEVKSKAVPTLPGYVADGWLPFGFLVHAHFLVDLGDHDTDEVREWLNKDVPVMRMTQLRKNHSTAENITRCCAYPIKPMLYFTKSLNSKATRSETRLDDHMFRLLTGLHIKVGLRGVVLQTGIKDMASSHEGPKETSPLPPSIGAEGALVAQVSPEN